MRKNLKTIAIASSAALIAASIVAWAAQTNYLGTVFIADSTTPSQQLKVNADGSINASNTSAAPLYVAGNESGTAPVQTATPANASHTAGQSVGGLFTIPMLRVAGGGGLLEYIPIMSVGGDPAPLQVSVWDRMPTNSNFACTDNSAYADGSGSTGGTVGADQSHMLPGFPQSVTLAVPAQTTGDAKSYGWLRCLPPISVKNQDGTPSVNLYVCLKATSTYTPGGAAYYVNAIGPQD